MHQYKILAFVLLALEAVYSFNEDILNEEILQKGGYEKTDVYLPCQTNISEIDRQSVWWQKDGNYIGRYSTANGFQPSADPDMVGKFNMSSLKGDLLVYSLNKSMDVGIYHCRIELVSGANVTNTTGIELLIGNPPSQFHIQTNGVDIESCNGHTGESNMTCSVVSDPPSTIVWEIENGVAENCLGYQNGTRKCDTYQGDQFNCSSTLTPIPGCVGYSCHVTYSLADRNVNLSDCVVVPDDVYWYLLTVFLIIIAVLITMVCVCLIVLLCTGVLACAGCACFTCFTACKKKTPITPTVNQNQEIAMYTTTKEQVNPAYNDSPPAYSYMA